MGPDVRGARRRRRHRRRRRRRCELCGCSASARAAVRPGRERRCFTSRHERFVGDEVGDGEVGVLGGHPLGHVQQPPARPPLRQRREDEAGERVTALASQRRRRPRRPGWRRRPHRSRRCASRPTARASRRACAPPPDAPRGRSTFFRGVVLRHDQVERAVRIVLPATVQLLQEMGATERAVGDHEIPAHDCLPSGLPPGAARRVDVSSVRQPTPNDDPGQTTLGAGRR